MNWVGNVGGFLKNFLGGLLGKEGTNLDGQEYINNQDPNYLKLPWDVRKKYDESVGNQSSNPWGGGEDVKTAGLVGFEDWTGPKEHGPFPDIFKSKGINQKGLKSLMEEMQEYRRRGIL